MTIIELFREDRDACKTLVERELIFRMYTIALLETRDHHRIKDTEEHRPHSEPIAWRKASVDSELPRRWDTFWNRITKADLDHLEAALIRMKAQGVE